MLPIAIPMAVSLDAHLLVCIGAVLSGGIFGDHCSPISDTTILSSTGAGADHIDHVKTQFPYALLNAIDSICRIYCSGYYRKRSHLNFDSNTSHLSCACYIKMNARKNKKGVQYK